MIPFQVVQAMILSQVVQETILSQVVQETIPITLILVMSIQAKQSWKQVAVEPIQSPLLHQLTL